MDPAPRKPPFVVRPGAPPALQARYSDWLGEPGAEPADGLAVRLDADGLALAADTGLTLRVDYATGPTGWRLRQASLKREALARACGLKHGRRPAVLDATAGLGRDALVLAQLGAPVTLVERSPVLAALVDDGLRRAAGAPWLAEAVARTRLINADAREPLAGGVAQPAVVYLDPMFEPDRRRGAAAKAMALLERLLPAAGDGAELLAPARALAADRVVVKRHRLAPPLADATPSFSLTGRSTRFDVYLCGGTPAASPSR